MGELGAGKTAFVQGFYNGLKIKKRVMSPTFILVRRSALRHTRFSNAYHMDAYRIKNPRELSALGFKEMINDPKNIVLIEWADKIRRALPKGTHWLKFSHGEKKNERIIVIIKP